MLANGPAARSAFGGLAHALADFYSHSNWVELNIAAGQRGQVPGPQLFPACDPAAFPNRVHTVFYSLISGPTGCSARRSAARLSGVPPHLEQRRALHH